MCYLGIDLGTSGVKVVLMNAQHTVLAEAASPLTVSRPHPLWSEQHPHDWWAALENAAATLKENFPREFAAIRAIGLSGQQHGAVLLDNQQRVLRPAILWNDGRAFAECRELAERVPAYADITGNLIMPGFTAPKLRWVAQHEAHIFQQIDKVLLPKDYLRLRLCGERISDMSDAAGTSWLNVAERDWSDDMLAACDLTRAHMPSLVEGNAVTGTLNREIAERWGLSPATQIVGGAGDNAASAISMNVIREGSAFLSLGTSGVFFVSSKKYRANPAGAVHTFCHCVPMHWHHMSVHLSATACLDWCRDIWQEKNMAGLLKEVEQHTVANPDLIFLPYLSGERTPHNNPHAKGAFFGMTHKTTRADLLRAVLEGVTFAFADGQASMQAADIAIGEVSVTGGGAQNHFWGQMLASTLNRPLVYRQHRSVGAALGAARLAWLALHPCDPDSAFALPAIENTFQPDAAQVEFYQRKQKLFQNLYQNTHSLFTHSLLTH